jgi:hypothetical protein
LSLPISKQAVEKFAKKAILTNSMKLFQDVFFLFSFTSSSFFVLFFVFCLLFFYVVVSIISLTGGGKVRPER